MWQGCCLQKTSTSCFCLICSGSCGLRMHVLVCAAALPGITCMQDGLLTACCRLGWLAGVRCLITALHMIMLGQNFLMCGPDDFWLNRSLSAPS